MTVYSLTIGNVNRAQGRSVVGAAAYGARSCLYDERSCGKYDFSGAVGLVHSELVFPEEMRTRWEDRAEFWNGVEAIEQGDKSVLAREVEGILPEGLSDEASVAAAREFVVGAFLAWRRPADLNVHRAQAADGQERHFVYVLSPLRWDEREDREGGVPWVTSHLLDGWRKRWAGLVNCRLLAEGRVDRIGTGLGETWGRGLELIKSVTEGSEHELRWRNGARVLAEPGLVLAHLTRDRHTFTLGELIACVQEFTVGEKQSAEALYRVQSLPTIVKLGVNEKGEELFSVRGEACLKDRGKVGRESNREDRTDDDYAYSLLMKGRAYVGLRSAVTVWESEGLRVRGVGLTFERAKMFEKASGVGTVGVHGILGRWKKKKDLLEGRDVLVVNEMSKLSEAQKNWILKAVRREKAKLVVMMGEEFIVIDGRAVGLDERQTGAMGWVVGG